MNCLTGRSKSFVGRRFGYDYDGDECQFSLKHIGGLEFGGFTYNFALPSSPAFATLDTHQCPLAPTNNGFGSISSMSCRTYKQLGGT
ncbi:hypothetical protein QYF36_002713 [Acer negundo]|nr:hypothetical protein QYF36_002713 [Acer negundo]